ncbi:hypothetical protein JCM19241_5981 [Vibrio ishigakensis]|uniref:Uncharacterized protein n=1 Tax=Vibrio ishigakensis TaxID=1481914 RepID=A0A0B8QBP3_9VIBR|nr:hypothetical protein JCM19241_5981 [Vibrio ishigakensis]
MGNFIELDINPVELELSQTEKLTKPIEAMSIDEYLECLSYTETDELPTQDEMSKEVVDKMNSTYSKVMVGGKFRIAEERGSNLIFHPKNELKDFNAHLICHYKQSDSRGAVTRKRINAIDAFMQSSKASRFSEVIFNPAKVGDYGVTKNLFNGFPKTPDTSKLSS